MTYTKWIAMLTLFNDIMKMEPYPVTYSKWIALLTVITTNDDVFKLNE